MYYHGWGVIKDFDRSFAYFSNAGTFSGTYYFAGNVLLLRIWQIK